MRIDVPASPVAVLVFHGRRDTTVQFEGSETVKRSGRVDIGFEESMAFRAAASACVPVPQAKRTDHGRETVYSGGDRNATVVGFGIDEMGHG